MHSYLVGGGWHKRVTTISGNHVNCVAEERPSRWMETHTIIVNNVEKAKRKQRGGNVVSIILNGVIPGTAR